MKLSIRATFHLLAIGILALSYPDSLRASIELLNPVHLALTVEAQKQRLLNVEHSNLHSQGSQYLTWDVKEARALKICSKNSFQLFTVPVNPSVNIHAPKRSRHSWCYFVTPLKANVQVDFMLVMETLSNIDWKESAVYLKGLWLPLISLLQGTHPPSRTATTLSFTDDLQSMKGEQSTSRFMLISAPVQSPRGKSEFNKRNKKKDENYDKEQAVKAWEEKYRIPTDSDSDSDSDSEDLTCSACASGGDDDDDDERKGISPDETNFLVKIITRLSNSKKTKNKKQNAFSLTKSEKKTFEGILAKTDLNNLESSGFSVPAVSNWKTLFKELRKKL